jgi:hypothetical protein
MVQAGTRDDPELTDSANDVQRWPGVPTFDPSSDFISVWFHENEENLYLSMEVVELITYNPEIPNVLSTADHLIGAHVNGEGDQTPCSGWGTFNVRDHYYGQAGWQASLRIYWPMDQQTDGCTGDDFEVPITVEGNVVTFGVPWELLAGYVEAGDELTVSDARAGSGSTWPATPNDYADNAPGRSYIVEYGAPPASNATPDPDVNDGDDAAYGKAPASNATSDPGAEGAEDAAGNSFKQSPSGLMAPVGALAAILFLRRRRDEA